MSDTPTVDDASQPQIRAVVDATDDDRGRRARERFPLNTNFHVVPFDRDGKLLSADAFMAICQDISTTGIRLSHLHSLRYCRVLIRSIEYTDAPLTVEGKVAWTRAGDDLYESGFRFLRKLSAGELPHSPMV